MKKFNVNNYIYIQITETGWAHLKATVGDDCIKHCINSCKKEINDEVWHKLQAHSVFDLLPINFGGQPTYNTNVMFDDNDLTKKLWNLKNLEEQTLLKCAHI